MGGRAVAPEQMAGNLGRRLRMAREELGWSLPTASAATAIPAAYLDALERGRLDLLPGPVYTRGYVRTYATTLHLDGDEFTYAFCRLQPQGRFVVVDPSPSGPKRTPSSVPGRWVRVAGIVVGGFVVLVLLSAIWGAIGPREDDSSLDRPPQATRDQPGRQSAVPSPPAQPFPPPAPASLAPASSDDEGAVYSLGRDSFTVTVEPTGPVWVQVRAGPDGDVLFVDTLQAGNPQTVPAPPTGQLWLRVGDQSHVKVLVDGTPVTMPGTEGMPYNLDLRR